MKTLTDDIPVGYTYRPEIRDFSDLDKRYQEYYESGERIEVELKEGWEMMMGYGCRTDGKKLRFYVGRSTGVKPVYLMILNRNSMGGAPVPTGGVVSIRGLGIFMNKFK